MSPALASNSSAPSVMECVICHKWDGAKYSRADGNFTQWSEKLKDAMILNGIYAYVFDPFLSCPNSNTKPHAHANWNLNDCLAITFLRSALEDIEHCDLVMDKGPIKQIALLQEALLMYCSQSESLPVMASQITDIVKRAFDISEINTDLFTCIALLNSLNDPSVEALQNSVSTLLSKSTKDLLCSSTDIWLLMENTQNIINSKANTTATALNAKGGSNLATPTSPDTIIVQVQRAARTKGEGMARKSIANAQNAQRASKKKPNAPSTNTSAQTKSFSAVTGLDGKLWYVDLINLRQLPAPPKTAAFAGIAGTQLPTIALDHSTEHWEHTGFMAFKDLRMTILNWNHYTKPIEDHIMATDISPISTARKNPLTSLTSIPFLVDSGATVHISPCCDDFFTLCPILPHSVKGLGGSSVAAIGIGSIRLHVVKGAHIILEDVLYIPNATVCLISVSSLANKGLDSHFDNMSIKIVNRSSHTLIAHGPLIPNQHLYSLNLDSTFIEHRALTAYHTANLETWHCYLGHANYQTIVDMAKSGMVPGMPSTFTSKPPKCDSCILRKQTQNTVPKVQDEGHRAMQRLKIVWVDLTGPQAVVSQNGHRYIMNLVDDYTSENWSILLWKKGDVFMHLKAWQIARKTEIQEKLGTYRMGHDGKLEGHKMEAWLLSQGSERQFGAAYTLAHIGQVKHMHRTLMGKA
ncbi:hypothetical protein E4T56_gene11117 [Termitomyces sp. T112]|nr:hypothetical protein E4T56_gene11117 [Termitomyces sp. T112]